MEELGKVLIPIRIKLRELAYMVIPKLSKVLEWITNNLDLLKIVLGVVIGAWVVYRSVLLGVMAINFIQNIIGWIKYLNMMWPLILSVTGATNMWGVAQAVLNMIMLANPIGLIVIGIMALIAAGVAIYKYWGKIGQFFSWLWGGIKDSFKAAIDWIVGKFTAVTDWIGEKWKSVKEFFGFGDEPKATGEGTTGTNNVADTGVPGFASGTNYVPKNMFAMVHKGEAIVPAKYNSGAGQGTVNNINTSVSLAVPAGTAENQAAYLKKVAKQTVEETWQSILRQTAVVNAGE